MQIVKRSDGTLAWSSLRQDEDRLRGYSPEDAVIERIGYEYRLKEIIQKLETMAPSATAKTFNLTFKGIPQP